MDFLFRPLNSQLDSLYIVLPQICLPSTLLRIHRPETSLCRIFLLNFMKISLAELLFLSVTQLGTVDVLCLGIFG